MNSLISGYEAKNFRIPMIQLTEQMKLNKKEGPSVDTSIPLRRGNKIITGSIGERYIDGRG